MTTETAPDPIIHDWSDDLEQELVKEGMDDAQARAYARAFELGMTRVLSVMATKYELKAEIAQLRDDLRGEIAQLRDDLRREMEIRGRYLLVSLTIGFGILAGLMGAILARI